MVVPSHHPTLTKGCVPCRNRYTPMFFGLPGDTLIPSDSVCPRAALHLCCLANFCVGETQLSAGYAAMVLPAAHGGGTSRDCAGAWFVPPGPVSRCELL